MSKAKKYQLINKTGAKQVLAGIAKLEQGDLVEIDEARAAEFRAPRAKAMGWIVKEIGENGTKKITKPKNASNGGNGNGRIE